MVDQIFGQIAADGDLVHVGVGGVEKAVLLGQRYDRQRVLPAFGCDRRAFERIERDVDLVVILTIVSKGHFAHEGDAVLSTRELSR